MWTDLTKEHNDALKIPYEVTFRYGSMEKTVTVIANSRKQAEELLRKEWRVELILSIVDPEET